MSITESLTVEILGDSSGLQQELSQVADTLSGLQQQFESLTEGTGNFSGQLQGFSSAVGPLQSIGQHLQGISQLILGLTQQTQSFRQQLAALGQQPVTINVAPAMGALQQLAIAAQGVAQQLASLNFSSAVGGPFSMMATVGARASVQGFATGGFVTGPPGIDQVPARLSSGEFVLNRDAVSSVGVSTLNLLNEGRLNSTPVSNSSALLSTDRIGRKERNFPSRSDSTYVTQTSNHFGGISIHVRESLDATSLLRELQRQEIALRHRRG